MSLFDSIRSLWSGDSGSSRGAGGSYLIDAARLADDRGGNRLGPREQVQILQQLSRFAAQEKMRITAVFQGRALREVADGGDFNGVTVFFAEADGALQDVLLKQFRKEGKQSVTVITGDAELEKRVLEEGGRVMRASTLRKAMGGGGGGNGGGGDRDRQRHSGRRRQGGNRPRPPMDRAPDAVANAAPAQASTEAPAQAASAAPQEPVSAPRPEEKENKPNNAVRNLIDLVE